MLSNWSCSLSLLCDDSTRRRRVLLASAVWGAVCVHGTLSAVFVRHGSMRRFGCASREELIVMKLDQRQKILVGALVGVLVLWQGSGAVWGLVFGPYNDRYSQIEILDQQLGKKQKAQRELEIAERRMRLFERRSLPAEPAVASTLYHHWLLDLAGKHEFERLVVTPKRIGVSFANQTFVPIPVSISAECTTEQLCHFLYEFYRTDLLHKVKHLGIESTEFSKDPKLKVVLDIEGLSLIKSPPRNRLFADKQEQQVAATMAKREFSEFERLIDKNHFVRGYNGPPKPPVLPSPPPPPFDSAPHVKLVACVEVEGASAEAWLFDQSANKQVILSKGSSFEIAGVRGNVTDVAKDFVLLKVDQKDFRLELGSSLKELKPVSVPANPAVAPAATSAEVGEKGGATSSSVSTSPVALDSKAVTQQPAATTNSGP